MNLSPFRKEDRVAEPGKDVGMARPWTRAEYVASQVKSYIYRNGLKPGDRIPSETELAAELEVSRPTLREAIRGLALSGLLEARPRTGTRVREFSYDQIAEALVAHLFLGEVDLREILEARAALELSGLPLVVERATAGEIAQMRAIEQEFERVTHENGDHVALDLKLHEAILAATGNRLLASMVGLLRGFFAHPSLEDTIIERHMDEAERNRTINEHRLVIEAIAARDLALAQRTLHEHFDRQLRWLRDEGNGTGAAPVS